jgi:hypothetical protein
MGSKWPFINYVEKVLDKICPIAEIFRYYSLEYMSQAINKKMIDPYPNANLMVKRTRRLWITPLKNTGN